jgi:hypothetical protein
MVTRLLSAAFWLGEWEIDDIVRIRRTGDSTWQPRVTVELYLYGIWGYGAQGTEHGELVLRTCIYRAESVSDSCSPSTSNEAYSHIY